MQVSQRGKIIQIQPSQKLPLKRVGRDVGLLLLLIWGLFAFFTLLQSQPAGPLAPYFIALTAFILIAVFLGLVLRYRRHYLHIVFDAQQKILSTRGIWWYRTISFDDIDCLRLHKYRYKRGQFLFRLEAVLRAGKTIAIIRDVPQSEPLYRLGKKLDRIARIPFEAPEQPD